MTADFLQRLVRTARLDQRAFTEVEEDPRATGQAALVVGLSALAAGIGGGGRDPGSIFAVGVREALDYESRWRAVGVTALGWVAQALLLALVLWMLGTTRPT